jgi:hypothetical protein
MSRARWVRLALAALVVSFGLLLLPCLRRVRDGEGWVRSQVSLRQIGVALRTYHDVNGRLPPAVVRGEDGRALSSWRVLLLPYLEQEGLYKQFRPDEPWDGPHNRGLLVRTPRCYEPALGGNDAPGLTRYQLFVGAGTPFEREGLTWQDFPDGPANTILVAEAGEPVPWSKPADLAFHPGGPLPLLGGAFGKPVHFLCYEVGRRPGFNAVFGDGKTRFIREETDDGTVRGLITRNGGEDVSAARLD